jgi:hypothetical protein
MLWRRGWKTESFTHVRKFEGWDKPCMKRDNEGGWDHERDLAIGPTTSAMQFLFHHSWDET